MSDDQGGASGAAPGYFDSPWPGEDGGPCRLQWVRGGPAARGPGLAGAARSRLGLRCRHALACTMVVLRRPGEVYLLRHTLFRAYAGIPTSSWVERIDPVTLEPVQRSPELAGGPFWPGGLAAHANGSLYVVYGRHAHRLDPDCRPLASERLPAERPYNSFVLLPDGMLVTKDFDRTCRHRSQLSVLEPERLRPAGPPLTMPEPCLARLSARGSTVYVVGERHLFRVHWDAASGQLQLDDGWRLPYRADGGAYGWDPVLEGERIWWMDNGDHTYFRHMLGQGVAPGPVHLLCARTDASRPVLRRAISGRPHGAITNPPLWVRVNGQRRVLAYDSANAVLACFAAGEDGPADLVWRRTGFAAGGHMIFFPGTGEVVTSDFRWPGGDALVVLDAATGRDLGRVATGSPFQSVLFPSPGWDRDLYYVSFSTVARAFVENEV
jgi:hypothetical protein